MLGRVTRSTLGHARAGRAACEGRVAKAAARVLKPYYSSGGRVTDGSTTDVSKPGFS